MREGYALVPKGTHVHVVGTKFQQVAERLTDFPAEEQGRWEVVETTLLDDDD